MIMDFEEILWRAHENFEEQNKVLETSTIIVNRCIIITINLLAKDFFFQILAHPVFKMWVIQKPNNVALWNKRHFGEKKMEIIQHV